MLGWSYDGEHWQRDTQPFLDRNPRPGTWDRAMTWGDSQVIVGDHPISWKGKLADLRDKPVQVQFKLAEAELHSFDLR